MHDVCTMYLHEIGLVLISIMPQTKQVETIQSSSAFDGSTLRTYTLKLFYGTQTGSAKRFAEQLATLARNNGVNVSVADLKDCDPEDTLTHEV